MTAQTDVLLVIGSGQQRYREYLLASAAERHPVWLIDAAEPTWQRPHVTGWNVVPLLDRDRLVPDRERILATVQEIAAAHRIAGVFTYDETLVTTAALIAEKLGLPGLTADGADRCRNKHRTRAALTQAGLPQPRFALAYTLAEAREAAASVGFPMVLKPRGMGASIGVVRVDDPAAFDDAFTMAERAGHGGSPDYEGGVLLEEFMTGPEISVDGVSVEGVYEPVFLAHKQTGFAPYFEETGHVVDAADPLLTDPELLRVLRSAHEALHVSTGITHTEVLFTARGPVVVEVNARLGGDLIPWLGELATGISPGRVAADLALGHHPDLTPTEHRTAGIRFAYPPHDCRVQSVSVPSPTTLPGLLQAEPIAPEGTELRLPPSGYLSRYAYVICTAPDHPTCEKRLTEATAATRLTHTPLP
ncbi:ATP-grasp domain-containing protein [Streptomyces sp. LaPpAH-108]|uniref:ATP-grasp domain-containing protein n=1 Tax=Streptomyces sp. LaPpAH-108 TaxID=1155714 RepID=UPI000375720E|nr:ATP-grasp domain-containing protein [Streptomyces sp. LaPpAH-108]